MSSSVEISTSKKLCVKSHLSWEAFRTEIFRYILYSTAPAQSDAGIGGQISRLIQVYLLDLSKLPIPMLKAFLRRIAKKKNSFEWVSFMFKPGLKEAVPDSLPLYKKQAGAMILVKEGGIERENEWSMHVNFRVLATRKSWKRGKRFVVSFKKKYRTMHETGLVPSSKLDTYKFQPCMSFEWIREGCLTDLIADKNFLCHLRFLILNGIYRMKRVKFCQRKAVKNKGRKQYEVFCGGEVPEGCDCCRNCFRDSFGEFVANL